METDAHDGYAELINDPKVALGFIRFMFEENRKLERRIAELERKKAAEAQQVLGLEEKLTRLKQLYFGHGREKLTDAVESRPRGRPEQEVLLHSQSLAPAPKTQKKPLVEEETIFEVEPMRLEALAREQHAEIPEGTELKFTSSPGWFEESTEITVVERTYKQIRYKRRNYKAVVRMADGSEKEIIVTAPGPVKLLPGCHYSIDFAVQVVSDKFLMHMPYERQRRAMERAGLVVPVSTLWNLSWAVSAHLEPVTEAIRRQVLSAIAVPHADETPWPIQAKKDSDGYLWSISNAAGSYYRFEPTRSGKVIKEMLAGYQGTVMSDGYGGYNRLAELEGINQSYCWAHVRRKFFEIEQANAGSAREMVELIDRLFAVERQADGSWEKLQQLRCETSASIVDEIRRWAEERIGTCLPKSSLRKAIEYMFKLWPGLVRFLSDVKIPLSNNDAERALRHAVVGRKNYYGSKTIDGADVAAILFTIIESCKRVELDPATYIGMAVRLSARAQDVPTPLDYARQIRASQVDPA
jgi:transposase